MDDQTLYRDDYLSSVAPGDRPANIQVGTAVSRASIFLNIRGRLASWNAVELLLHLADEDDAFMKQYDCKFHTERICTKCNNFNMKV